MKGNHLFFFMCLFTSGTFAQLSVQNDLGVRTTFAETLPNWKSTCRNYEGITLKEGSPYFQDAWTKGKIITLDKRLVTGLELKIDLLAGHVHQKDSTGKEWVIDEPLSELLLEQGENSKPLHFIYGTMLPNLRLGWYQLLLNDTISLVKGWKKSIDLRISYGNPPEHQLSTNVSYWAYLYHQEFEVKKPMDFVRLLPSKKAEIEQKVKALDSRLSLDDKLFRIASFCNTLNGLKRF